MTGLLVSVRNAEEARIALACGVDVIDVKEPARGSLGAASAATVGDVVDAVAGRALVSIACGELLDAGDGSSNGLCAGASQSPPGVALAKIGLAGCKDREDWQALWRHWASSLPRSVRPVAVAYADQRLARSPSWESVVALAAAVRAPYVLIDTYDKRSGTLFDHWPAATLKDFADAAQAAGVGFVLAGSLRCEDIERAVSFGPDYVAVRGAACRGGREGTLDPRAIERLLAALGRKPHANEQMKTAITSMDRAAEVAT